MYSPYELSTTNGRGKILDDLDRNGPVNSAGSLCRRLGGYSSSANTIRHLDRMLLEGWVDAWVSDTRTNLGGGRPARGWKITKVGREVLEQIRERKPREYPAKGVVCSNPVCLHPVSQHGRHGKCAMQCGCTGSPELVDRENAENPPTPGDPE